MYKKHISLTDVSLCKPAMLKSEIHFYFYLVTMKLKWFVEVKQSMKEKYIIGISLYEPIAGASIPPKTLEQVPPSPSLPLSFPFLPSFLQSLLPPIPSLP